MLRKSFKNLRFSLTYKLVKTWDVIASSVEVHSPLISMPSLLDDGAADLLVSGRSDQSSVAHRSGRRSWQAGAAPRWTGEKGCDEECKIEHLGYCQCGGRVKARVLTCCAHNI